MSGSLRRKSIFFQNGSHFSEKVQNKQTIYLCLWIIAIYTYIISFMQFWNYRVLNKHELTINTINLIGPGGKKTRKRGAAVAWYTDQSNTSRRIFNSGQEIISRHKLIVLNLNFFQIAEYHYSSQLSEHTKNFYTGKIIQKGQSFSLPPPNL